MCIACVINEYSGPPAPSGRRNVFKLAYDPMYYEGLYIIIKILICDWLTNCRPGKVNSK